MITIVDRTSQKWALKKAINKYEMIRARNEEKYGEPDDKVKIIFNKLESSFKEVIGKKYSG